MSTYRHNDSPPVPFHAMCTGMAVSMHAEIKALHGLLLDAAESLGVSPEDTEKAIVYRINQEGEER